MLGLTGWAKWAAPILIIIMLLGTSCTFVVPPPTTPVTTTTLPSPKSEPENHKPVINYMTSEQQVTPSSSTRITCVATDADNDTLTYTWSVNSGTIIGTGDTVTWTAPQAAGTYIITAMVTDTKGGEAKDSVTIAVTPKPNRAPMVTLIVREKNEPPVNITPATGKITVKKWSTTEIECKAEDPDGDPISYKWSATEGKIDGEGPIVHYIASTPGDIAVTVTASDNRGAQTKTSVYFKVPCCGGF
jgi:chitinase